MRAITYAIILTAVLIVAMVFTQAEASDKCGDQRAVAKYLIENGFLAAVSWGYYDGKIVTIWGGQDDKWVMTTTRDSTTCLTTAGEGYAIHGTKL